MRIVWRTAAILVALVGLFFFGDYYIRCHGKPLSRAEAIQRAPAQLQYISRYFELGEAPLELADAEYDAPSRAWILTFRNDTCAISVLADRCHGIEIGGISEGCRQR